MQISSMTSILSATISSFNSEAGTELKTCQQTQYGLSYEETFTFLTFFQNEGVAEICSPKAKGYMNFVFSETGDDLYGYIPNDNGHFLDVSASAETGIFQVVIGGTSPGRLSFPAANNTVNSQVSGLVVPAVDGVPYMFFSDSSNIDHGLIDCSPLWIADNTGYSHGWSLADMYFISQH